MIGYDFCKEHADNATSAYGEEDGYVNCFVGVSDFPAPECDITKVDELILTSGKKWPYTATCNVYLESEEIDEYSRAVTPPVRQIGNRLSRPTEIACASLLA